MVQLYYIKLTINNQRTMNPNLTSEPTLVSAKTGTFLDKLITQLETSINQIRISIQKDGSVF